MAGYRSRFSGVALVTFDLEGTIVDLEKLHHEAHLLAAAEQGVDLSLESAIAKIPHFVGGPDETVAAEIASSQPFPIDQARFLEAKRAFFDRAFRNLKSIAPRPGFTEFLARVFQLGVNIAIGTATRRKMAEEILNRSGLRARIPNAPLIAREDVLRPKPAPDVYLKTAEALGVSCSKQLVFEDSPGGVSAARAAGSRVIAVPAVRSDLLVQRLLSEGAEAVYEKWDSQELGALKT